MISYLDIIFVVITVVLIVVSIKRGFIVSLLSMIRLLIIPPLAYLMIDLVMPYVTNIKTISMPEVLLKVIVFAVCFVVLLILSSIILIILKKLQKKKGMPLRHTNAILGGVFGIVKSAVILVCVSTVLIFVSDYVDKNGDFYQAVTNSYVINFVQQFNPLVK